MERTKKFKFNVLDVVIVIVVIACLAGLVLRSSLADKVIQKDVEAIVTFRITGVRTDVARESLLEEDIYYCKEFNGAFGSLYNVKDFEYTPAKVYYRGDDGTLVESGLSHRSDVVGYFKVSGRFDDEVGFLIDGIHQVGPGAVHEVNSAHRKMQIQVISVEPVK